jgi:hypothetical protein
MPCTVQKFESYDKPLSFVQANTHNIEISQAASGDLSMDCMYMTLLSPVRHHEVFQDYEAPSQE